jgi:PHD/YefM family antitoxin component YafN of YafNO toxin-antitoxin module
MSGLDALQSVQFVTVQGKRFAVLSADDWETLIDWLETLEDMQTVRQARADLAAADGDRKRAGWLEWESIREELE